MHQLKPLALSLIGGLLIAASAFAGQTACPAHYANGVAPDFINQKLATKTRELCNEGYAVEHSGVSRTPLWAAEHLTKEHLKMGKGLPRSNTFRPDPRVPAGERSELRDFARSGFDRGHLASAADAYTPVGKDETFYLSNMIPQNPANNRGLWEGIESAVRTEAMRRGELYVITGPVFQGTKLRYLNGRVVVPSGIYKAVYDPARQQAGVYFVANEDTPDYQVISLTELEKITGIDLFPGLSSQVKNKTMPLPAPKPHRNKKGGI